jgi:peptidylprolyl isomerase
VIERFVGASIVVAIWAGLPAQAASKDGSFDTSKLGNGVYALLRVTRGEILCKLNHQFTPLTVINFVGLAEGTKPCNRPSGTHFYDGLTFHRADPNVLIQGGCPLGDGMGGPGYRFPDEFIPTLRHSGAGVLSMANSGPSANGSQFFITRAATPWLDGKHTIFGRVVRGQNVVNAIRKGDTLNTVKILRIGKEAEAFRADEETFVKALAFAGDPQKMAARQKLAKVFSGMDVSVSESGLISTVLKEGKGEPPPPGSVVTAHYAGWLVDGKMFDSSFERGVPVKFTLGRGGVIPGWSEVVLQMKPGEKRKIGLLPHLAYGSQSKGKYIPADSTLVFDIELLGFRGPGAPPTRPRPRAGSSRRK